jgi:hypothetical protein
MHRIEPFGRLRLAAALVSLTLTLAGCQSGGKDPSLIGTFRMGETVQAGHLIYQVLESEWRTDLGGRQPPQHRYLAVRVSIQNVGNRPIGVPGFTLEGSGQTYPEITENLGDLPDWLGMLRTVQPGMTDQGYVVFDAPVSAYNLVVSDAGEIGSEKYAHINIPVNLE